LLLPDRREGLVAKKYAVISMQFSGKNIPKRFK